MDNNTPTISHPTGKVNFTRTTDTTGRVFYFSYTTVIAFTDGFGGLVVTENVWGPTTGKHLNWIDGGDKSTRLGREAFLARLESLGVNA